MKSYQEHLSSTNSEIYKNNKKFEVLRSSAIFPFLINKEIDTKILFLGYWLLKRKIKDIIVKITLRTIKGKVIKKKKIRIDYVKSFQVSVKKTIKKKLTNQNLIGSIEIEILSKIDMVYPYPAVVANFESKSSSTVVHTCGRVFNNKNDLKTNNKFNVPETGIDVLPNKNLSPFFSFVNGKTKLKNEIINIKIINYNGEILKKKISIKNLNPYETMFVHFLTENEKKFLKNQKGTIKINHNFKSFFPRFLSGNMEINKKITSLTHTYYDTSKEKDKNAFWKNPDKKIFFDSTVSFPLFKNKKSYFWVIGF